MPRHLLLILRWLPCPMLDNILSTAIGRPPSAALTFSTSKPPPCSFVNYPRAKSQLGYGVALAIRARLAAECLERSLETSVETGTPFFGTAARRNV